MQPDIQTETVLEFPAGSAFYEGIHPYMFRTGQRAEILALVHTPRNDSGTVVNRTMFKVKYADGAIDYVPVSDVGNYRVWFD